jgi:hypothetical protein
MEGLMNHTPAEAAKRRSTACWLGLTAALALSWVLQAGAPEPVARAAGARVFPPAWQVTGSAAASQDAQVLICSRRDLQEFARADQLAIDEPNDIVIAPRPALSVAWEPGVVAATAFTDLRVQVTRIFNPRAPPSPQA